MTKEERRLRAWLRALALKMENKRALRLSPVETEEFRKALAVADIWKIEP